MPAQLAGLPLPLWSVLTAVIVTQMSVGRTLRASIDYMLGTIGGSIYGGARDLVRVVDEWGPGERVASEPVS